MSAGSGLEKDDVAGHKAKAAVRPARSASLRNLAMGDCQPSSLILIQARPWAP
jgi:hypothetical protein